MTEIKETESLSYTDPDTGNVYDIDAYDVENTKIDAQRQESIKEILEESGFSEEEMRAEFLNQEGFAQIKDRLYVTAYNFENFIQENPVILLNPDLYHSAYQINNAMYDLYQALDVEKEFNDRK